MHRIFLPLLILPALLWAALPAGGSLNLENRNRASFPEFPNDISGLTSFLADVDAYVADNIGLRDQLIAVKRRLDFVLNSRSNDRVIAGEGGWFFYNAPEVVERASGIIYQPERVENMLRYAFEARELSNAVGAKGFVVVPVPNSHSVYEKFLPSWARADNKYARTEQRSIVEGLQSSKVMTTDPYLLFTRRDLDGEPLYFRRDTHWNDFGAYIAFYDSMIKLGLQGRFPEPDAILKGYVEGEYYGVLDQFLGLAEPAASEPLPELDLALFAQHPEIEVSEIDDHVSMDSYEVNYSTEGPKLLVIGDSFTYSFFRKFWGAGFSAVHWSHHDYGRYDRAYFERFRPDYVIFEFVDWEIPAWVPFDMRFQ